VTGAAGPHGRRALLVVNADDYGLTEVISRAILRAHHEGIVTSTSVLALAPAFAASVRWLDEAPTLGLGAHLAAVGEDPPLLSAREVPTLVDTRGRMWSSWRAFLPRAAAGRIDPDDLRREFGAQIEAITSAGVTIDHLDTHQNIHLWPMVADVVLELGEQHGVRTVRVTRSTERGPVGLTVRRLAARLESRLRARGWRWPEASTGLDEAGCLEMGAMVAALARLAATGARSAELATHPGGPDDPERFRYRWNYQWEDEYAALRSATVRTAVTELGFELGTFADLAEESP
jgi:chitin disaccharide deacetylase